MSTTKKRASALTSHDLLAAAEAMLPEISAAADEADNVRRVPDWLAQRLNDAGFFHLLTGREHGGMDADPGLLRRRSLKSCPPPARQWVG